MIVAVQKVYEIRVGSLPPLGGRILGQNREWSSLTILIKEQQMQENLFIGNLSFSTTDDSLKAFFEGVGEVKSARVITDRDSGRSRGFGFVEFADGANNQKAIDELNGKELDGREITVGVAKPKSNDGPRGGGNTFRQSYR